MARLNPSSEKPEYTEVLVVPSACCQIQVEIICEAEAAWVHAISAENNTNFFMGSSLKLEANYPIKKGPDVNIRSLLKMITGRQKDRQLKIRLLHFARDAFN